jgi:GMP synthase (glutamine-hydrolysing)
MEILIIQFRTDQSGWHEVKCLYEGLGIEYQNLTIVNIASESETTSSLLDAASRADKVIIGGLAESGFEEIDNEKSRKVKQLIKKVYPVINYLVSNEVPTLGLCFGHQLIAQTLGAEIVVDQKLAESDVVEIQLTENGAKDPIFDGLGDKFLAIEGHKSSVKNLPEGTVHLAKTEKCPINGFRYGKNAYGLQFHAELSRKDYLDRVALYPEYIDNTVNKDEEIVNSELVAKKILENFAKLQ